MTSACYAPADCFIINFAFSWYSTKNPPIHAPREWIITNASEKRLKKKIEKKKKLETQQDHGILFIIVWPLGMVLVKVITRVSVNKTWTNHIYVPGHNSSNGRGHYPFEKSRTIPMERVAEWGLELLIQWRLIYQLDDTRHPLNNQYNNTKIHAWNRVDKCGLNARDDKSKFNLFRKDNCVISKPHLDDRGFTEEFPSSPTQESALH